MLSALLTAPHCADTCAQLQASGYIHVPAIHGSDVLPGNATVEFREGARHMWGPAQWLALGVEHFTALWQVCGCFRSCTCKLLPDRLCFVQNIAGQMMVQLATALQQPSLTASVKLVSLWHEVSALARRLLMSVRTCN